MINSKHIFENMVEEVGLLQTREIMSAWAGLKVARIGIKAKKINSLIKFLNELKLHFKVSNNLVFSKRDIGKGGWSNKFDERVGLPENMGDFLIYVSNDANLLNRSVESEEEGDEEEFGVNLGIPNCCIDFYTKNLNSAYEKQNDFVPLVLNNTKELHSFNFWNNYVAQYFGYSFLSFFPCSFNCSNAAKFAQNTCDLINSILPEKASKIIHFQKQPILYTEYRGIYLFEGAACNSGNIFLKDVTLHATVSSKSKTLEKMLNLDSININGRNSLTFIDNEGNESHSTNNNLAMCTFQ